MADRKSTDIYVIDTNVLLGFRKWHPFKFSADFWNKMEVLLKEGKYIILDVVDKEITFPKDIREWLDDQKEFITEIDLETQSQAIEINAEYDMIDETTKFKSEADVYIIAFAKDNNYSIFTRESAKDPGETRNKIPDVCKALKINYIRYPVQFMASMGF